MASSTDDAAMRRGGPRRVTPGEVNDAGQQGGQLGVDGGFERQAGAAGQAGAGAAGGAGAAMSGKAPRRMTKGEINSIFTRADNDSDNVLSRREFKFLMNSMSSKQQQRAGAHTRPLFSST